MFGFGGKKEEKASKVGAINVQFSKGKAVFTDRKYDSLAKEAYERNAVAYRCISLIASSASSVPWQVKRGEEVVKDHPLVDLLTKPNQLQCGIELLEEMFSYYLLSGNCYLEAITVRNAPVELYSFRPDRVKIVPNSNGLVGKYRYTVNGKHYDYNVDNNGYSKILHIKSFHPSDDWYGMSPLEASSYAVDQHNEAGKWNVGLLQNGCRPSGALVYKPTNDSDVMSEEQRASVRSELSASYEGADNAGRPLLLEGGLSWVEMSLNNRDIDYVAGKNLSSTEIAMAYNIPPQLVGVEGSQTFANYEQARLSLYDEAVLPLLNRFQAEINIWIKQYYPNLSLSYNIDTIPALSVRREKNLELANNAKWLTINEKRLLGSKMFGIELEDLPEGDVLVDQNNNPQKDGGKHNDTML